MESKDQLVTKVRKLTRMNVIALRETKLGRNLGSTYVEFEGSPVAALAAVQEAMNNLPARDTTYQSLEAVRRKLNIAASRYRVDAEGWVGNRAFTPYVTVTRNKPNGKRPR